ncbi:MAG TPA: glucose-6-phosphate dehydrogenase, partial [Mycobacterium sp.]
MLVIFGITGDLARKMTFRALYRLERRELLPCPVLGVASDDISTEELIKRARKAIADSGEDVDAHVFDRLADRLSYLHGDVTEP